MFFSRTFEHNLGWKHACISSAEELRHDDILKRDIYFISLTKNPYSWLLSLHRKPYSHQHKRGKPDFETFLRSLWKTVARDNCGELLESPVALWNIKNTSYLQLADLNGLNLTTESTVQEPAAVIEKISGHFSIDKRSDLFINHEKFTKDGSKDFAWYQDYYSNERWRDKLSVEAISIISAAVDKNLMSHFRYEVLG